MKTAIYSLRDELGVTRYIGKTIRTLRERRMSHLREARQGETSGKSEWIRSMMSRGFEPRIDLVEMADGDGDTEERKWIASTRALGMNLVNYTDGGSRHPSLCVAAFKGKNLSEEHKRKLSISHIGLAVGRKASAETRRKMSESMKGKMTEERRLQLIESNKTRVWTPEQRAKIAERNKGRKMSEWHKQRIIEGVKKALTGRPVSPEMKRRLATMHKGRKLTAEHRAKISAGLKGKRKGAKLTEEHRKKLSEIHKRRWAAKKSA